MFTKYSLSDVGERVLCHSTTSLWYRLYMHDWTPPNLFYPVHATLESKANNLERTSSCENVVVGITEGPGSGANQLANLDARLLEIAPVRLNAL